MSWWWQLFGSRRRREDALRRLGGPDLNAERKKNAMNGEQRAWVLIAMTIALLLGWLIWNIQNHSNAVTAAEAASGPTAAEMLACVNHCASACADQAESSVP